MMLALCTGVIKLEKVKRASDFLIEIMPPMFIPAAAGLVAVWDILLGILAGVFSSLGSVLGMAALFGLDHTYYVTLLPCNRHLKSPGTG